MNDDPQDDQNQPAAYQSDEDIAGEASPSGDSPEDVQDVDDTEASVGLPTDTPQGPKELGIGEEIDTAEEDHQED